MTYSEAKRIQAGLMTECAKHSASLAAFPKGALNLTPDHVKSSPEFQIAKRNFDRALKALRDFNSKFVRTFARDIRVERRERNTHTTPQSRSQHREV